MERIIATFSVPHLRENPPNEWMSYLLDPHTSLWKYAVNAFQSVFLLLRVRPQVILTTGAGIAIPTALIGKLMGKKLIVVETGACIHTPSKTGAFLYRYADLFIVQWEELLQHYPDAVYGGPLI